MVLYFSVLIRSLVNCLACRHENISLSLLKPSYVMVRVNLQMSLLMGCSCFAMSFLGPWVPFFASVLPVSLL